MKDPLSAELTTVLHRLRRQHEVLPFLSQMLPVSEVRLALMPASMLEQLRTSPDFTSICPSEPVWLSIAGPDDLAAELVIYRAEANGYYYVVAPQGDHVERT